MTKHFVSKSDTETSEKDLWQTPVDLFNALNNEFDFDVDICASAGNSLCELYFTKEHSALENQWVEPYDWYEAPEIRNAFINPPIQPNNIVFISR